MVILGDIQAAIADPRVSANALNLSGMRIRAEHAREIREALNEDAEDLGYDTPEAMVATFSRSDMLWSEDGRKNLLVWYLAERTAHEITDEAHQ